MDLKISWFFALGPLEITGKIVDKYCFDLSIGVVILAKAKSGHHNQKNKQIFYEFSQYKIEAISLPKMQHKYSISPLLNQFNNF